ncbi:long chain acyl-CoA synthetase 4 [Striga asiatica]|uniref:Long chain acyl-CoA synthetase 4 n=1 Tax=Striga asiatica TaxID=4170 RepID=A0A5A7PNU9_STRAF|nr:long chain acyl-CoA synthetase 4 [Striga asiatica]
MELGTHQSQIDEVNGHLNEILNQEVDGVHDLVEESEEEEVRGYFFEEGPENDYGAESSGLSVNHGPGAGLSAASASTGQSVGRTGCSGLGSATVSAGVPAGHRTGSGPRCFGCGDFGHRQAACPRVAGSRKYIWVTYKEVFDIVLQIGNSIRSCGVADRGRCEIYGANSPERVLSMEACNAHELYCVPLSDILGVGAIAYFTCHAESTLDFVGQKIIFDLPNPFLGDIGEWQPEGSLKFVDFRRNNFKHSGEEYVEVENFEKVYDIVSIWVYGNNWEAFLVAIINPTKQAVEQWEAQNFLVAIINPNIQAVEQWAAQIGVSGDCNALSY